MRLSHRIVAVLATSLLILPALASESPSKPLHWPVYRGDAARSNRGAGGPRVLQALWRQSMIFEWGHTAIVRARIRRAERESLQIIPAFSPVALTALDNKGANKPLLVYKSYFGVMAVDLRNGQLAWASPSNWGLQRMLSASDSRQRLMIQWLLDESEKQHPRSLFENSTISTVSTDGRFVYVVDDFAVPPPRIARKRQDDRQNSSIHTPAAKYGISQSKISYSDLLFNRVPPNVPYDVRYDPETEDAIRHNRLYALDLSRPGALSWSLGEEEKDPLCDHSFLGPPLPLNGLLYVLVQKEQQVSLLCIQLQADNRRRIQPKIVFMKPLLDTATSLLEDPIRRTQAAHLAYADGVLVCPTNAGTIFGIDLATRWHAWVYPYRKQDDKAKDRWKVTAPVIAGGKVVFTPPDDPSIHCLNLSDGAVQWSRKKSEEDVYLGGVYGDKVLIVGSKSVRALNLANGETLWTQETGLPSGQGIASGKAYYLPLQRGAQSKQPEICVLDLNTGKVIDHLKTQPRTPHGKDFDVPGNLVFVEGKLISQSRWEIVAYPSR